MSITMSPRFSLKRQRTISKYAKLNPNIACGSRVMIISLCIVGIKILDTCYNTHLSMIRMNRWYTLHNELSRLLLIFLIYQMDKHNMIKCEALPTILLYVY